MKGLFLCAYVLGVAWSASDFKPLDEVYGVLPAVDHMEPRRIKSNLRVANELYRAKRLPENCIFPLDIVLVQDATDSFSDDYVQMATVQLPLMTSILNETHPGSQFGLLSFQDKPIPPFGISATASNGYYSDYCAHIDSPITDNYTAIQEIYSQRKPNGGGDPPENQFYSLLGATQASGIQWSNSPERARLIVVITDAPPHFADDGSDPQGMLPSSGTFDENNIDQQCLKEFYPSPAQVKASIEAKATYVAFVVYDPEYFYGLVGKSWQWFNRYLGQTESFITLQAQDSSDFWVRLSGIIGHIEDIECQPVSSPIPTTQSTSLTSITTPSDNTVTPVGTIESTPLGPLTSPSVSGGCPPCPPCSQPPCECICQPTECPTMTKICEDGLMIKMGEPIPDLKVLVNGEAWP